MEAQLTIFDQPAPAPPPILNAREQILEECYALRGHKDIFARIPSTLERLVYLRDWMKAFKEGGTQRVEELGLQVEGSVDRRTLEIEHQSKPL